MKTVQTGKAPEAIGPYSQAVVAGGTAEQTEQIFKNLRAVLQAAGTDLGAVAMVNVYLCSMADFTAMNAVYARAFGDHKPARATVGVAELPKNALVEISCVASLSK